MLTKKQLQMVKKWKSSNIKISKELRDIIHGYIMSDGYLSASGGLQIKQSRKQRKFVEWLYEKLELIRTDTPILDEMVVDKRSNKKSYNSRFNTRNLLEGFRFMWYKPYKTEKGVLKYKKSLPKSLDCFFNYICLTLWFAGDGTKILGSQGAKIEVTAFTADERLRLQELFLKKFNLSVQINRAGQSKKDTQQWTLNINASEYQKFRNLITKIDLIPNFFPHKLHKAE